MQRFFEFMGNHPFLFGLLFALIILFFLVENKRSGKKIAPSELGLLVNNQNAQIIDIRPKAKFETGYIQGSRNIPFTEFQANLNELKAATTPLIIVCDIGLQASAAVALLGKDNVYRLEGGVTNWQASGMPLVGAKKNK
ncbi:MAG: rhodanese-like domain-containing protein [Moraxella sp.]|nr:rhodanese-like domain-containing protein [Moraxella sp.]